MVRRRSRSKRDSACVAVAWMVATPVSARVAGRVPERQVVVADVVAAVALQREVRVTATRRPDGRRRRQRRPGDQRDAGAAGQHHGDGPADPRPRSRPGP